MGVISKLAGLGKPKLPDYPIYVFHHIPKCAGSAVTKTLENWFNIQKDYITLAQLKGKEKVSKPINLSKLKENTCLVSHFESEYNYLELRYPNVLKEPDHFFLFTFLREPLELRTSLYYYEIKARRRMASKEDLRTFLLAHPNYISQRFPCTDNNFEEVLGRYNFIGIQEQLQTSMDSLAEVLNKPKIEVPKVNLSK